MAEKVIHFSMKSDYDDFFAGKKTLVTGGTGLIGRAIVKYLCDAGANVTSVSLDNLNTDSRAHHLNLDLTQFSNCLQLTDGIDYVFHVAGIKGSIEVTKSKPASFFVPLLMFNTNVLEASRINNIKKVFFPSSIAVFGDKAPLTNTPQSAFLNPSTVYGISKAAGENWAQYYFTKYGLDIRSIRYPGIIGYQSMPGGGTTDYAVDIYHSAVKNEVFSCFLDSETKLPMMFMNDAVRSTIELMQSPIENMNTRTSYNLAGMSFSPNEIYKEIKKSYPSFKIEYNIDSRQTIADKWPKSIDDNEARNDWGWKPKYNLTTMTSIMLEKLKEKYNKTD